MNKCKLAQELIDAIIGDLHDDAWTLRSCSLVCRSWLPTSHRHFFHRIVFSPPGKCYYRSPRDVSYRYSKRLYRLSLDSPYVSNYIQELKVYEGQRLKGQAWIETDQILPFLLRRLTNLKRIEFLPLNWIALSLNLRRSICCVLELPSMRFVEIEHAYFANMEDFGSLLRRAEGLTGLSLTSIHMNDLTHKDREAEEGEQRLDSHQQRHLVNLRLALGKYPVLVDWLLGSRSPWDVSHIRTLHILDFCRSNANTINRLLHGIGKSLRHLQLYAPWDLRNENSVVDINLEFNSDITFLHLTHVTRRRGGTTGSLPRLLRFLSNIKKSNRLEEIKLEMGIPGCDEGPVDWSAWEELDCLLARAHFEFLKKVDIELWRGGTTPEWFSETCKNLVRGFPLLAARGVLVDAH